MKKIYLLIICLILMKLENSYALAPTLDGQWKKSCAVYNEDDYMTSTLIIAKNQWHVVYTAYEDDKCQTPYLQFIRDYEFNLESSDLNLRALSSHYIPLTNETAEALRLAAWCGQKNWQLGESIDVTGRTCGDYQVQNKNQMTYSRYELTSEQKKLFLGQSSVDHDGSSPTQRHIQNEAQAYEKAN